MQRLRRTEPVAMKIETTATLTVYGPLTFAVLQQFVEGLADWPEDTRITIKTYDDQRDGSSTIITAHR